MAFLNVKIRLRGAKYFSKIQRAEIKYVESDKRCNIIDTMTNEDIWMKGRMYLLNEITDGIES
jgi:hypothetical protein